jgi:hypothetical protein
MLPSLVVDKRKAGLEACHYTKEFILQRVRLLDRREKLTFECPQFADPSHNPSSDENSKL